MRKRIMQCIMSISIIITIVSPIFFPGLSKHATLPPGSLVTSASIFINGNSDPNLGTTYPGAGTELNPYRIENLTVDASSVGNAIKILSVNVFIVIRNCTVTRSGPQSIYAGINLEQCVNIKIQECRITNNRNGIALYLSQNITIFNNNISANTKDGIYSENSSSNIISQNLIHNNLEHGIDLVSHSSGSRIAVNSFKANSLGNYYWDATGPGNAWSFGILGNYWADYTTRYPLAVNDSVTWKTPYVISSTANQRDMYPLVSFAGVHEPIIINSNLEMDAFPDKSGSGTALSPYVIQNLKISAGTSAYAIQIKNVNRYLVLLNITTTGAIYALYNAGIMFENCSNINVTQCQSRGNSIGIYSTYSSGLKFSRNNFSGNDYRGLFLDTCLNTTLISNNLSSNGFDGIALRTCINGSIDDSFIEQNRKDGVFFDNTYNFTTFNNSVRSNLGSGFYLQSSFNVSITSSVLSNNSYYGAVLELSSYCTLNQNNISSSNAGIKLVESIHANISGNRFEHCDITFQGPLIDVMVGHYIDPTNKVDGKPIIYLFNQENLAPSTFLGAGTIILANCTNGSITGLSITETTTGIQLLYSRNITIENCTLTNLHLAGVYLENSTYNTIKTSKFTNNKYSIHISTDSGRNTIINNTITGGEAAIYLQYTYEDVIDDNDLEGCGLLLDSLNDFQASSHLISQQNWVNQRVLYYYVNQTSLGAVNFSNAGQILLSNCNNSIISNVDVSNATCGLILSQSNYNNITGVNSSFNSKIGILVTSYSKYNNISNCITNNNKEQGIALIFWSSRNRISCSMSSDNGQNGITAFGGAGFNTVENCSIYRNNNGIYSVWSSNELNINGNNVAFNSINGIHMDGTVKHHIIGNNVSFNQGVGIYIGANTENPNWVYGNLIVDNRISEAYSENMLTLWDNGSIGNFWGDYQARYPSATRTGNIWSLPYAINGTPAYFDHYPFYRNSVPLANFSVDCQIGLVGEQIQFSFNGSPGDAPFTFQWRFGDSSGNSTGANPLHVFSSQSNYTIRVTVIDRENEMSSKTRYLVVLQGTFDFDGDTLTNQDEIRIYNTNPLEADSDGDTIQDGWEILHSLNPLNFTDGFDDPDHDGLTNAQEYSSNTIPWDSDTDGDSIPDGWEVQHGLDPRVADAIADSDGDGLSNGQEYAYDTNPHNKDTDGDIMWDLWEIQHSLNPLNASDGALDLDGDGLTNSQEFQSQTDPRDPDSDDDSFSDGVEVQWLSNPNNTLDTPITKWILWPGVVIGSIIMVLVLTARIRKQEKYKSIISRAPATPDSAALTFDDSLKAGVSQQQQHLQEKQSILSRILAPQTSSEIAEANKARAIDDLEGMKAKKAKSASGSEESIEHKVDETLEKELKVEVKEELCIVCGTSLKGTSYVCPFCKTKYCIRCAIMLSERQESCWTCKNVVEFD